jgi:hypothetical protein
MSIFIFYRTPFRGGFGLLRRRGFGKNLEEVSEGKKRKTKKNLGPVPTSQIQFMP